MEDLYEHLTTDSIDLNHGAAVKWLRRRSRWLIEATIELYESAVESGQTIRNPGGWINRALEQTWAAKIANKAKPSRRKKSGSPVAVASIIEDSELTGHGRPPDDRVGGGGKGASARPAGPSSDITSHDKTSGGPMQATNTETKTRRDAMSRREAIAFLEDHRLLTRRRPLTHWFHVEPGQPPRFYPTSALRSWKGEQQDD